MVRVEKKSYWKLEIHAIFATMLVIVVKANKPWATPYLNFEKIFVSVDFAVAKIAFAHTAGVVVDVVVASIACDDIHNAAVAVAAVVAAAAVVAVGIVDSYGIYYPIEAGYDEVVQL